MSAICNCPSLNRAARVSKRFFDGQDRKNRSLTVAALILFLFCGCASTRVIPMTGRSLVELDEAWAAAAASRNIDASMDFWVESAIVFLPDLPPVYGKTAIREFLDRERSDLRNEISWTPSCAGVDERGSMAYTLGEGHLSMLDDSGVPRKRHSRYVAIWRKEGDRWRCAVKCWTPTPKQNVTIP